MKKLIRSSVLGFLFALFFTPVFAAEVVIPDAALKRAIWQSLGKPGPVGILTEVDILSLTDLDASARNVQQLDGLGAAHNLTSLNLNNNQLTSLTLPAGLTSLTWLYLGNNQLTSLTLPAGLTSLTTLNLDFSQLTSLTLPKTLAENNLQSLVDSLRTEGVVITLLLPAPILAAGSLNSAGVFDFILTGSPGQYQIQVTPDFSTWTELNLVTIPQSGSVQVTDPSASARPRSYYRAVFSN